MNTSATKSSQSAILTGALKSGLASRTFAITPGDLFAIGWGFGLSASGGGGSLVDGINLAQAMFDGGFVGLDALSTSLAPLGEAVVIAGGMGAPSALGGDLQDFVPACLAALDALSNSGLVPMPISGITPIEAGPVNGILPIYICWQSGGQYKLYDCDGAGRAVPSLTNLLFDFEGITFSPSAQASIDASQTNLDNTWANGTQGEAGLRDVIAGYGGAIGLAAWPQTGATLSRASLVQGTYGAAATRGNQTYSLRGLPSDLFSYLAAMAPNAEFSGLTWRATFNEIFRDPDGLANGYDKGYIVFGRDTIELGAEYRMYFLNENLFISRHSSADGAFLSYIATAPSTIACYFSDPNPPTSLQCSPGDFIPYNTGDNNIIETLTGQEVIVSVSSPSTLLYQGAVQSSFVTVLNDYFSEPPYGFAFTQADIYPTTGDIFPRYRKL